MPRNVRNFWIQADIDGRSSPFASGPVSKDGGFRLVINMRDNGNVTNALSIEGYNDNGTLRLNVFDYSDGQRVHQIETRR